MTLSDAAQTAISAHVQMSANMDSLNVQSAALLRVLNGPGLEIRADLRAEVFRAAVNDPRLSILRAASSQVQRPDFRAGLFGAQPAQFGIAQAAPFDPRLRQGTHTVLTWLALFSRRDIGVV